MTIEAVETRYGGLFTKVTDLTPEIEEGNKEPYRDPDNPHIGHIPKPPDLVTRFESEYLGRKKGPRFHLEYAQAVGPDVVIYTVFDLDLHRGTREANEKVLTKEQINEANLTEGNWKKRVTWRWRP